MQVILTHEQADFDSLASQLGASLLNEDALAVLPRRVNRNLRAFLTLYGAQLPFVEPGDLPVEKIEAAILVDTQSLVTLKGMNRHTSVHVIDHHQKRASVPDTWTVKTDQVGACTTLFVEELRERDTDLTTIEATLLLLGIYEDTGSLSYASTTPRDLWAAAYLLEHGASLRITGEYLNVPLSPEQRMLYDRLLAAAEHHPVHGQNIVIARAQAEGLAEEISSIAHKMRDLLDLDALFLLVHTQEGIYLVARSTTDKVDVSKAAAYFGGGGHERAASALIRAKTSDSPPVSLESVYQELLSHLPKVVSPSISVAQIMSRQPLMLAPDAPVQEAARQMQRYGYEGFPVVKEKKVVGLLTRRAVDRAISHRLNLPVSSLMEAGEISVAPQDALENLQRVMMSSGWGQVPVVEPANGEIIGIVTRTDLLKALLTDSAVPSKRQNLSTRLETALPAPRLALLKLIAAQAHEQHLGIYIVGGFVRDLLLDLPDIDYDIVVEGDAVALGRALVKKYGGRVVVHSRFGTAKWWMVDTQKGTSPPAPSLWDGEGITRELRHALGCEFCDIPPSVDLISARTEFYEYPTALPTIRGSSIKLDLHRRDFTINTLALRLDGYHYGELHDYWGGLNDLHAGLVRVLHSLSFVDDPTRLLRAVRFEQRFNFSIEERTRQLMKEAYPLIRQVSGERLYHEINLVFKEAHPERVFQRLQDLDLLQAIHAELHWDASLSAPLERVLQVPLDERWELPPHIGNIPLRLALGYLVWLARLPVPAIRDITACLHLPGDLKAALLSACLLWQELSDWKLSKPSEITARLSGVPPVALYAISCLDMEGMVRPLILQYITDWRGRKPGTNGDNLRARGIKPGPVYHHILDRLRDAWIDGELTSEAEEQAMLAQLLEQHHLQHTMG